MAATQPHLDTRLQFVKQKASKGACNSPASSPAPRSVWQLRFLSLKYTLLEQLARASPTLWVGVSWWGLTVREALLRHGSLQAMHIRPRDRQPLPVLWLRAILVFVAALVWTRSQVRDTDIPAAHTSHGDAGGIYAQDHSHWLPSLCFCCSWFSVPSRNWNRHA